MEYHECRRLNQHGFYTGWPLGNHLISMQIKSKATAVRLVTALFITAVWNLPAGEIHCDANGGGQAIDTCWLVQVALSL